jgi:hypothetical protein
VQQAHKTTSISDRLRPPQDGLCISFALVLIHQAIFRHALTLVHRADREHKQEGKSRTGDESEEVGFGQGVDVVHLESVRDTELVDEGGHKLRVRFEGDEGRAAIGRVGVCC